MPTGDRRSNYISRVVKFEDGDYLIRLHEMLETLDKKTLAFFHRNGYKGIPEKNAVGK